MVLDSDTVKSAHVSCRFSERQRNPSKRKRESNGVPPQRNRALRTIFTTLATGAADDFRSSCRQAALTREWRFAIAGRQNSSTFGRNAVREPIFRVAKGLSVWNNFRFVQDFRKRPACEFIRHEQTGFEEIALPQSPARRLPASASLEFPGNEFSVSPVLPGIDIKLVSYQ